MRINDGNMMKGRKNNMKFKRLFSLFGVCAVLVSLNVYGSETGNLTATADTSGRLKITAGTDMAAGSDVTVAVYRPHMSVDNVKADDVASGGERLDENLAFIAQTKVEAKSGMNTFEINTALPSDAGSGIYTVYSKVYGEAEPKTASFEYLNREKRAEAEQKLAEHESVKTLLDKYCDEFSFELGAKYFDCSEKEKTYIAANTDKSADRVSTFVAAVQTAFDRLDLINAFKAGLKSDTIAKITAPENILSISDTELNRFKSLSEAKQEVAALNFCTAISKTDDPNQINVTKLLSEAVDAAKKSSSSSTGGGGGGGGGGTISAGGFANAKNSAPITPTESDLKSDTAEIFGDLSEAEWSKTAVYALYDKEIISGKGDGIFAPNDKITREEFVKLVCLAFELEEKTTELKFTDVNENDWFFKYICTAVEAGVINGVSETEFGTGQPIMRQDMAAIIYRAVKSDSQFEIYSAGGNADFSDSADIADYAKEAVTKLAESKMLNGMGDGLFNPKGLATRAEAVQLIYNILFK